MLADDQWKNTQFARRAASRLKHGAFPWRSRSFVRLVTLRRRLERTLERSAPFSISDWSEEIRQVTSAPTGSLVSVANDISYVGPEL